MYCVNEFEHYVLNIKQQKGGIMVKVMLFVDKFLSLIFPFQTFFERTVTKIILYKSWGKHFDFLLEMNIKSLIEDLTFLHDNSELKVKREELCYTTRSIDLNEYPKYKGYKISIFISKNVKFISQRYLDFKIEKKGKKIFIHRFELNQTENGEISAVPGSRFSSDLIVEIIKFFDEIGIDSENYVPIVKLKKAS